MTIAAVTAWGQALGTGIVGPYAIPFSLYDQTQLQVLTVVNNVPTLMVLGTDYTFTSFTQDNKGQCASPAITFTSVVAGGTLIVFLLAPAGTQTTQITNYPTFFPAIHEARFDQLAMKTLQLVQWMGKAIKCPDFEQAGATNQTMPAIADRASKVAGWDANGNLTATAAVPAGSVSFSTFGEALAAIASLTALLNLLGLFTVANQGALAGLTPITNGINIAYQQDTGDYWVYNGIVADWIKLAQVTP